MAHVSDDARTLMKLAAILHEECEHSSWRGAVATSREVLAVASKVNARLRAVHEVLEEGYAIAEVDRAIARNTDS